MAVKRNFADEPTHRQPPHGGRRNRNFGNDLADAYSNNFRKVYGAKSTDYFCSLINAYKGRFSPLSVLETCPPPYKEYGRFLLPSTHMRENPMSSLCTQWINTVYNYDSSRSASRIDPVTGQQAGGRGAFTAIRWTAGGRRLIASTTYGDFVLWNGHSYTMDSRMNQAHENGTACRVLVCSTKHDLLLSADDAGVVKLWQQSDFKALGKVEAHTASHGKNSDGQALQMAAQRFRNPSAIKDLSLSSSEEKFVTASRDGSARVWDADSLSLEQKLLGHGSDVLSAHWHPHYALIATSSSDNDIRLWDPRANTNVTDGQFATMQGHSLAVNRVRFCPNHYYSLLSASKDLTMRLWDIRMLQTTSIFSGHTKEPSDIAWHPHHRDLFASVGFDGILAYWVVDYGSATKFYKTEITNEGSSKSVHDRWVAAIPDSHGNFRDTPTSIQSVAWHPLGHVLATSAFDGRLWSRTQPGTEVELRYNENQDQSYDTTRTAEGARADLYNKLVSQNSAPEQATKLSDFVERNKEYLIAGSAGCIYVRPSAPQAIKDTVQELIAAQWPEDTDTADTKPEKPDEGLPADEATETEPSVSFLL